MRAAAVIMLTLLVVFGAMPASAQQGPGGMINPQRDCQTLLTCNFRKGGVYRGCLSSYSCRQCRLVAAPCQVGSKRRNCREFVCNWGA